VQTRSLLGFAAEGASKMRTFKTHEPPSVSFSYVSIEGWKIEVEKGHFALFRPPLLRRFLNVAGELK
jgi:hypothetical protein